MPVSPHAIAKQSLRTQWRWAALAGVWAALAVPAIGVAQVSQPLEAVAPALAGMSDAAAPGNPGVDMGRPITDWRLRYAIQTGLDYWHLHQVAPNEAVAQRLFMANGWPSWRYRDVAPWYVAEAVLSRRHATEVVLRARANQSLGSQVDQLYWDQLLSAHLGVRVGVVDYKVSWCRSYETDNRWVRENDPFCTSRTTNAATQTAPGLQAYVDLPLERFRVQGIMGVYNPLWFNYAPLEFTNTQLRPTYPRAEVLHNHKLGAALNVLDQRLGAEYRLSVVRTDQSAVIDPQDPTGWRQGWEQKSNLWSAAASWALGPKSRLRYTVLTSSLSAYFWTRSPQNLLGGHDTGGDRRDSHTLEWLYQASQRDAFGVGLSLYGYRTSAHRSPDDLFARDAQPPGPEQTSDFSQHALSVAWRHDWSKRLYTAVQWSYARNRQVRVFWPANAAFGDAPERQTRTSARGQGLGVRVAYIFD